MTLGLTAAQADSLVAVWRERQCCDSFREFFDNYILVDSTQTGAVPDSVYTRRLRDLASPIQLPYNSIVRGYINRYTDSRYGTISRILGMSQYYFPLIEDELLKEGLPIELRALPIIESALSVTAVSPMGAVGLWQFMPSTGKSYGLEVNSLVDERRDPVRSTQAACRYLKDLYAIYKDWSLAIAAYNCGPGNVNKALARAGEKSRTFWDIYDYLPAKRAATSPPSSVRRMPTPTTASTASNSPKPRFRWPPTPSASTGSCTSSRSPRQSTCRSKPCASSTRSTNSTSSRPRPNPIRWCFRSAA